MALTLLKACMVMPEVPILKEADLVDTPNNRKQILKDA